MKPPQKPRFPGDQRGIPLSARSPLPGHHRNTQRIERTVERRIIAGKPLGLRGRFKQRDQLLELGPLAHHVEQPMRPVKVAPQAGGGRNLERSLATDGDETTI